MNKSRSKHSTKSVPLTRESLRTRLETEFVEFHQRRRRLRRGTFIAGAAVLLVAMFSAIFVLNRAVQPDGSSVASNSRKTDVAGNDTAASNSSVFSAITVTELTDGQVHELLRSMNSTWFVAEIDGKPTAFSMN